MSCVDPAVAIAFAKELTELTRRYGVRLWACSCCDGINMIEMEPKDAGGEGGYRADGHELAWREER